MYFQVIKICKSKRSKISIRKNKFLNVFCDLYETSFFISLRAFLPSFRVLKTNHEIEEIIRTASVTRDIKVTSILLDIYKLHIEVKISINL